MTDREGGTGMKERLVATALALAMAGAMGCAAGQGGVADTRGTGVRHRPSSWSGSPVLNIRSNVEGASVPGFTPEREGNPSPPGLTAGAPSAPFRGKAPEPEAAAPAERAGFAEGTAAPGPGSGPPLGTGATPMPLGEPSQPPPFRPGAPGTEILKGETTRQRVPVPRTPAPPMPLGKPGRGPELSAASEPMPAGAAGEPPLKPIKGGPLFVRQP